MVKKLPLGMKIKYYKQYFGSKSKKVLDLDNFDTLICDIEKELKSTELHEKDKVLNLINFLLETVENKNSIKILDKLNKTYKKLNKEIV